MVSVPQNAGKQGDYNNVIALSPNCSSVAVGWQSGTFVSYDDGTSWTKLNDSLGLYGHLHADVHALIYDLGDFETLYIGSDGGMASASGLVAGATPSFVSNYNRQILDLQFSQVAPGSVFNGLVAGAFQDNGVLYTSTDSSSITPWQHGSACDCDGSLLGFVTPSQLATQTAILVFHENSYQFAQSLWSGIQSISQNAPFIPTLTDSNGITGQVLAIVKSPSFKNNLGEEMYAVAALSNTLYGLFARITGEDLHWESLGSVGAGETISSLSSRKGFEVLAGTQQGNIYLFPEPYNVQPFRLTVNSPESGAGSINAIVEMSLGIGFAAWNGSFGHILSWGGSSWHDVGLRSDIGFQALDVPDADGSVVFAMNTNHVYESPDMGQTWLSASDGLPVYPRGMDLRSITQPDGRKFLYLGTWGRSLWRAEVKQ